MVVGHFIANTDLYASPKKLMIVEIDLMHIHFYLSSELFTHFQVFFVSVWSQGS